MTTLRLVNQALRKLDIDRNVELARSPAGYYYFLGTDSKVPSLPANDLSAYTTEEIIKHVVDNLNESNNMSNIVPTGYYQVKKTFKITYGGAWAITLKADRVLRYDEDTKRLESYNPDEKKWVNRKPPIQGTNNMNFSRYGFARDQREVVSTFMNNTKKITKEEAEKIISAGTVSESKHRPIPTFENFETTNPEQLISTCKKILADKNKAGWEDEELKRINKELFYMGFIYDELMKTWVSDTHSD